MHRDRSGPLFANLSFPDVLSLGASKRKSVHFLTFQHRGQSFPPHQTPPRCVHQALSGGDSGLKVTGRVCVLVSSHNPEWRERLWKHLKQAALSLDLQICSDGLGGLLGSMMEALALLPVGFPVGMPLGETPGHLRTTPDYLLSASITINCMWSELPPDSLFPPN